MVWQTTENFIRALENAFRHFGVNPNGRDSHYLSRAASVELGRIPRAFRIARRCSLEKKFFSQSTATGFFIAASTPSQKTILASRALSAALIASCSRWSSLPHSVATNWRASGQIGRASCRERVWISVGAVSIKNKTLTVNNKGTHSDGVAYDDTLVFTRQ